MLALAMPGFLDRMRKKVLTPSERAKHSAREEMDYINHLLPPCEHQGMIMIQETPLTCFISQHAEHRISRMPFAG